MWMTRDLKRIRPCCIKSVATIAAKILTYIQCWPNVLVSWIQYGLRYTCNGLLDPTIERSGAVDTGYSDSSDWFFQMVFCATTCSIVSGTLAERIKI